MLDQQTTIEGKASIKHIKLQIFNHRKKKVGVGSHVYIIKTLHQCRIKKNWQGPLLFFPLYGQTKGGVVVGTTCYMSSISFEFSFHALVYYFQSFSQNRLVLYCFSCCTDLKNFLLPPHGERWIINFEGKGLRFNLGT